MMDDDDNEFVNNHCFTSESYFCEYKGRYLSTLKDKVVFVDEYTMTPDRFITKLYHAFTKYGIQVFMAGDINQCEPINGATSIRHNYFDDSISVFEMCPRRIQMKYVEGSSRYDQKTRIMSEKFLKFKSVKHKFEPIGDYYKNICFLNKTRRDVTEKCYNKFAENRENHVVNFLYKSRIEKYQVCVDMPIIGTQNLKKG